MFRSEMVESGDHVGGIHRAVLQHCCNVGRNRGVEVDRVDFVQIDPAGLFVAGGFYNSSPDSIARFRKTVDDDVRGAELEALLATLTKSGFEIGGDTLKTKPRGYEVDHPRIDLLRHKTLTAGKHFGSPAWLESPKAATKVRDAWRALSPLVEWSAALHT